MGKKEYVRNEQNDAGVFHGRDSDESPEQLDSLNDLNLELGRRLEELGKSSAQFNLHEELNGLWWGQIKNLRIRETTMQAEIERLSKTCAAQKVRLDREQQTICQLTAELEELQIELQSASGSAQIRLQAAIQEKDQQISVLKAAETTLKESLNEISQECECLKARALDSDNTIRRLEGAIEEERGKITQFRDDHNRKLAKITDVGWEKDLQIESLRKGEIELRKNIERLQQEAVAQERLTQGAEHQLLLLKIELATSQGEIEKLKTQCAYESKIRGGDRSMETEIVSTLKAQFNNEVVRLKNERMALESQLASALSSRTELASSLKEQFNQDLARAKDERAKVETQLVAAQNEVSSLKYELLQSQSSVHQGRLQTERAVYAARSEVEQALSVKTVKLQEMEAQKETLEREAKRAQLNEQRIKEDLERIVEKARQTESGLRGEITKLQGECSVLTVQLTAAKEQISEQRSGRAALERDLMKANEAVSALRETNLTHQGELQAAKDLAAKHCRNMDHRLRREMAEAEAKIQALVQDVAECKRTVSERDRRIEALLNEQDETVAEVTQLKTQLARTSELSTQVGMRENHLRIYANNLNKEKTDVQKIGKQLAQEIRLLSATHPLKDYLAATEFELSKIELQLKTTPTLSADRVKLEECVAQLIEQRDFLKTVLAGSQKQFDRQASGLEKMLSRGLLTPVPPPPPTRKTSQSVAGKAGEVKPTTEIEQLPSVRWEKPFEQMT